MCIPPQIIKSGIKFITVIMATFFPLRPWPYKCSKDNFINHYLNYLAIPAQANGRISTGYFKSQYSLRRIGNFSPQNITGTPPIRPNSPKGGNVITRKLRDWFPNFAGDVKLAITHGLNLLERFGLWGEPLWCSSTSAARSIYTTNHEILQR
jgi:hypothetical protein